MIARSSALVSPAPPLLRDPMPRPKKTAPSKVEFVRALPATLTANEVSQIVNDAATALLENSHLAVGT